ncbi:MAG: hypothetical protein QOF76_5562 [Solirubrobacteraceae bacterium]|nr:hypothetical protein [Solirubrobacteraceae bacterium]
MLHALIAFAASETSKTPFYICGGALAVWAVLVSLIGIARHEEWPANDGTARALMGVTALLVVAAMASAVATG